MPNEPARTSRLETRIAPDILAVVKQAAELQGRSVSDFVVSAAQDAAYRVIEEISVLKLTADEQRRFVDLLLNPPPPSPALLRAKEAHGRLFGS